MPGNALETADRFDRQPRQDLDDDIIREVGGGAGTLLGRIHLCACQSGKWGKWKKKRTIQIRDQRRAEVNKKDEDGARE